MGIHSNPISRLHLSEIIFSYYENIWSYIFHLTVEHIIYSINLFPKHNFIQISNMNNWQQLLWCKNDILNDKNKKRNDKIYSCSMLQNRSSSGFCLIFVLHEYDKVWTTVLTYTIHDIRKTHLKRIVKVYGYAIGESKTALLVIY